MGKIIGNDCCCSDWKSIIKELWSKYQNVVTTIRFHGKTCYPDGDGNVILPDVEISGTIAIWDMLTYWQIQTSDYSDATITDKTTYYELEV